MAALPFGACVDRDTTDVIPRGGSGGTAGRGNGGSAGRGTAGTAGRGGAAGTAGTGGASGGAGMSGNGGSSGSTGGTGDIPDGGLTPDGGDAALPPLVGRPAFATGICARLEEVADCASPASTCVDDLQTEWAAIEANDPGCVDEADAYYGCLVTEPAGSFFCDAGTPKINTFMTVNCGDEEAAFYFGLGTNCAPP